MPISRPNLMITSLAFAVCATFACGHASAQTRPVGTDLRFSDASATPLSFSSPDAWRTRSGSAATLSTVQPFAGLNLCFGVNAKLSYAATNDLGSDDSPFAIHSITLAPANQLLLDEPTRVTIQGKPLLLVGKTDLPAYIALGARDPKKAHATFDVAVNLHFAGRLNFIGDGNQTFRISGRLVEAQPGAGIEKSGTATAELTSSNEWTGPTIVRAGALLLREGDSIGSGPLEIKSGASVSFDGSTPRAGLSTELKLSGKAQVNLNGNAWVVDYTGTSPVESIMAMVREERITSLPIESGHTVACLEAASLGKTEFAGRTLDGTAVIIASARIGDTNLDGAVDMLDLKRVAKSFNGTGGWAEGDFTRDGKIDFDDLLKVSQNYDSNETFEADWGRAHNQ